MNAMNTVTLHLSALLDGHPGDIFEVLTDSRLHSEFSGAPSEIDATAGGRFSYFAGGLTGEFVELTPPHRMVQRLRASTWPDAHSATVTYQFATIDDVGRTHLKIVEENAPAENVDQIVDGWGDYLDRLHRYLRDRKLDVVRRFVDEYKNRQNPDIVDALVAEDCRVHIPLPGLPGGREGMRVNGQMMCGAFPDVHVKREFFVTDGDIVIERAHAKATHRGDIMGTPASNRPVTWTELHAYRVERGQITEVWSEADFMGVMVQIGAVRLPPEA